MPGTVRVCAFRSAFEFVLAGSSVHLTESVRCSRLIASDSMATGRSPQRRLSRSKRYCQAFAANSTGEAQSCPDCNQLQRNVDKSLVETAATPPRVKSCRIVPNRDHHRGPHDAEEGTNRRRTDGDEYSSRHRPRSPCRVEAGQGASSHNCVGRDLGRHQIICGRNKRVEQICALRAPDHYLQADEPSLVIGAIRRVVRAAQSRSVLGRR